MRSYELKYELMQIGKSDNWLADFFVTQNRVVDFLNTKELQESNDFSNYCMRPIH